MFFDANAAGELATARAVEEKLANFKTAKLFAFVGATLQNQGLPWRRC